jgi:hypothetical protein
MFGLPSEVLIAALVALLVTVAELAWEHGRLPYGRGSGTAIYLWMAIIGLDVLVAVGVVTTVLTVEIGAPDVGGNVGAAFIGLLAPLGLRSPVRRANVSGSEQEVGITYVYDVARYRLDWALDERMTRLRRRDITRVVAKCVAAGVDSVDLARRIRSHVDERRKLGEAEAAEINAGVSASLTLPTEGNRIEGLVNVLYRNRLRGLLSDLT